VTFRADLLRANCSYGFNYVRTVQKRHRQGLSNRGGTMERYPGGPGKHTPARGRSGTFHRLPSATANTQIALYSSEDEPIGEGLYASDSPGVNHLLTVRLRC